MSQSELPRRLTPDVLRDLLRRYAVLHPSHKLELMEEGWCELHSPEFYCYCPMSLFVVVHYPPSWTDGIWATGESLLQDYVARTAKKHFGEEYVDLFTAGFDNVAFQPGVISGHAKTVPFQDGRDCRREVFLAG